MREVYYFAYYKEKDNEKKQRMCMLSAVDKVDYIISGLNRIGVSVRVVSCNGGIENGIYHYNCRKENCNQYYFFFSIGRKSIVNKIIDWLLIRLQIIVFSLYHLRKNSIVIVYHSLGYVRLMRFLKKIIGFKMILEVEEIYADVVGSKRIERREKRLFDLADAYFFPTEMLDEKINWLRKPSSVIYGRYQLQRKYTSVFCDNKQHIVYAGSLDPRKGSFFVAEIAKYLDSNYCIHILGKDSDDVVTNLQKKINEISNTSKCSVSYDGCLSGEKYNRFIQSCDIGLSPQNPEAEFNETSFPSKILSYLSNRIPVLSISIPAILNSGIADLIVFYDKQSPNCVAEKIRTFPKVNEEYIENRLVQLDQQMIYSLEKIINEFS